MAADWLDCTIADACASIDYGLTASANKAASGAKFLRITDIVSGAIDWNSVPTVDADAKTLRKYALEHGDVVLARTGASTGSSAYVSDPPESVFASYLVRLKAKPEFDSRYLAYYLQSEPFLRYIRGVLGDKSAQPNASASTMTRAPFRAPRSLDEQRRIAHILGTLDDKIELNRRMNETLDEMARALFKSWFVDFDPVRAKAEGRDPGLPKHVADLFPDRLVDSGFGEVPEGWLNVPLDDEFRVTIGRTPPRKEAHWFSEQSSDVPWVSIRDMGRASAYLHDVGEFLTPDAVAKYHVEVVPAGTVLLSFKLTVGRVSIASRAVATNEAIAHFHPRSAASVHGLYLYSYLKQFDYNTLGNTSSIATAVNSKSVRAMPLLRPSAEAAGAFARESRPFFAKLEALDAETRALADSRDALLNVLLAPNRQVNASGGQDDRSR